MYIIIIGCGRVGSELAKILSDDLHDVVIIDKQQSAFRRLGDKFNGLTLCGNGCNSQMLKTAGIDKCDILCALTNGDNTNLMAAQLAKDIFKVKRVFARVYDPQRAQIYRSFGLEIISGTMLIALMIKDKIMDSRFTSSLIDIGDLVFVRIKIDDSRFTGKPVRDVNIKCEFSIISIIRGENSILPDAETILEYNDIALGLVKRNSLDRVKKRFKL